METNNEGVLEKNTIEHEPFINVKNHKVKCPVCGKMLFKGAVFKIEIKCKGCKTLTKFVDYDNQ